MSMPLPQQNSGFSNFNQRAARWDDGIVFYEIPDNKSWVQLRFYGNLYPLATHWLESRNKKMFPMLCSNFDSLTNTYSKTGCPICDEFDPRGSKIEEIKKLAPRQSGLIHVIRRDLQAQPVADPKFRPWSPVRLPVSLIISLQRLQGMNTHVIEGTTYHADVTDPNWGMDVYIMHDSQEKSPSARYACQRGNHTPLTPEERNYLAQQYDWKSLIILPTALEVKQALTQNGYYQLLNGGSLPSQAGVSHTIGNSVLPGLPNPPPSYTSATINPAAINVPPVGRPVQPTTVPMPEPGGFQTQRQFEQSSVVDPTQQYQNTVIQQRVQQQTVVQPQFTPPQIQPPQLQVVQPPQLQVVPPVAAPTPVVSSQPAVSDDRKFVYPARPEGVSKQEFQQVIADFAQGADISHRAMPLKNWDRDELSGVGVAACFGGYIGDMLCMKCPTRKQCIRY